MSLLSDRIVSVCPGGDLNFTCTTNLTFIEWTVAIYNSTSQSTVSRTRLLSSTGQFDPLLNIIPANRTFIIARKSSEPFVTALSVQGVAADLNGTTVNCTDIGRSSQAESSTSVTAIHVIGRETGTL